MTGQKAPVPLLKLFHWLPLLSDPVKPQVLLSLFQNMNYYGIIQQ